MDARTDGAHARRGEHRPPARPPPAALLDNRQDLPERETRDMFHVKHVSRETLLTKGYEMFDKRYVPLLMAAYEMEAAENRYNQALLDARAAGLSLFEIGAALGLSKQAVAHRLKVIRASTPRGVRGSGGFFPGCTRPLDI